MSETASESKEQQLIEENHQLKLQVASQEKLHQKLHLRISALHKENIDLKSDNEHLRRLFDNNELIKKCKQKSLIRKAEHNVRKQYEDEVRHYQQQIRKLKLELQDKEREIMHLKEELTETRLALEYAKINVLGGGDIDEDDSELEDIDQDVIMENKIIRNSVRQTQMNIEIKKQPRKSKKGIKMVPWTEEENKAVLDGVKRFRNSNRKWKDIQEHYPVLARRTADQIHAHYRRLKQKATDKHVSKQLNTIDKFFSKR